MFGESFRREEIAIGRSAWGGTRNYCGEDGLNRKSLVLRACPPAAEAGFCQRRELVKRKKEAWIASFQGEGAGVLEARLRYVSKEGNETYAAQKKRVKERVLSRAAERITLGKAPAHVGKADYYCNRGASGKGNHVSWGNEAWRENCWGERRNNNNEEDQMNECIRKQDTCSGGQLSQRHLERSAPKARKVLKTRIEDTRLREGLG